MIEKYALWKVFDVLAKGKEYSVREMSRTAKIGSGTSKACLDYLHKQGFLKKKVIGNIYQYSLELKNPAARQARNSLIVKWIVDSGIANNASQLYLCSNPDRTIILAAGDIPENDFQGIMIEKTSEKDLQKRKESFSDSIKVK